MTEIHQHQRVDRVVEIRIDVDPDEASVELQVLAQQDGHAFAAGCKTAVGFVD